MAKKKTKKELEKELSEAKEKIDELEDNVNQKEDENIRLIAEIQNMVKRLRKEREIGKKEGIREAIQKLSDVIDIVIQATSENELTGLDKQRKKGFKMLREEMEKRLNSLGVKIDNPMGKKFDYRLHNAVAVDEQKNKEDGIITDVIQRGIIFKDEVIRPALVKVVKNKNNIAKENKKTGGGS